MVGGGWEEGGFWVGCWERVVVLGYLGFLWWRESGCWVVERVVVFERVVGLLREGGGWERGRLWRHEVARSAGGWRAVKDGARRYGWRLLAPLTVTASILVHADGVNLCSRCR